MTEQRIRKARPRQFKVWLAAQDCDQLYLHARARGIARPEDLLCEILHIVLRDDLLNAVLDDGERSDAPAARAMNERDLDPAGARGSPGAPVRDG
jgi:hypothetical protein